MIRLLALDMDGTCLNGRSRMTEETIRTIRKAADAGIIFNNKFSSIHQKKEDVHAKIRNKFNMRTKRTHVFYDADSFSNPLFSCVNFPKT